MGESLSKKYISFYVISKAINMGPMMTEITERPEQKSFNQPRSNLQTICLELLAGYHVFCEDTKTPCGRYSMITVIILK